MFSDCLAVALVSWLAALSPGPDFFIILRNSLSYSRRIGFYTTFGVCLGLFVHLFYTVIGIGTLIAKSVFVYHLVKYIGAIYLFYIGLSSLISSFKKTSSMNISYITSLKQISPFMAIKQGFLTNTLNPKAALFFISLFSQFINVDTSTFLKITYAVINWFVVFVWFFLLSYLVTNHLFIKKIRQFQLHIDRVMGSALILLSIKLAFI